MGYTTDFYGQFEINPPLDQNQIEYLEKLSDTRRMKRDASKAALLQDDVREMVGLEVGEEGEYFVGGTGLAGQDEDDSILEYNAPPAAQPALWCQWIPAEEGSKLEWDGNEKFYNYVEWLEYIIQHFMKPWGRTLNGSVKFKGESFDDIGTIIIENNVVNVKNCFDEEEPEKQGISDIDRAIAEFAKGILTYVEDGNVIELRACGFVDELKAKVALLETFAVIHVDSGEEVKGEFSSEDAAYNWLNNAVIKLGWDINDYSVEKYTP